MTPWLPDDAELDAVARTLDPAQPSVERAEELRTTVLAGAATQRQLSRRSLAPIIIAGAAIAAAAVVVIWLARSPEPSSTSSSTSASIAAIGDARFERVASWPDYIVRLDGGTITVTVGPLRPGERFRITTVDAEVAVVPVDDPRHDTKLDVGAAHDTLASVAVREGSVEIRVRDEAPVVVAAGHSWMATITARRDDLTAPSPATPLTTASGDASKTDRSTTAAKATTTTDRSTTSAKATPTADRSTTAAKATTTTGDRSTAAGSAAKSTTSSGNTKTAVSQPGEDEFRSGWAALKSGDMPAAVTAFSAACTAALHDALGEDACFWLGVAAKRGGDTSTAHAAFARFIAQFPASARVAEASALLGWLLYDAGDLDGAEQRFHRAEHDRVPAVRDSAERGLTAIARRRKP